MSKSNSAKEGDEQQHNNTSSSFLSFGSGSSHGPSKKSGRKISLPWFRQSSVTSSHAALSRQHTIDSPGSFRFFRKGGLLEMTWVICDYIATQGTSELSVTKGQQVEIVDMNCTGAPEYCLVRLQINSSDSQEGLVPVSVLKPLPSSHGKINNKQRDAEPLGDIPQENDSILPNQHTSPVNKRKGFSGKKWLPQQFRKLSHGKSDKLPPVEKTLIKKGSEKKIKEKEKEESLPISAQPEIEAEDEAAIELPPPMKPIQDQPSTLAATPSSQNTTAEEQTNNSSSSCSNSNKITKALSLKSLEDNQAADVAEIEQIVKEKVLKHEASLTLKYFENDTNLSDDPTCTTKIAISPQISENENLDDNVTEEQCVEDILKRRNFALKELLATEEAYVNDLSQIINGYIAEIRNPNSVVLLPDDLKGGKERMVFGNIEAIYEWHRDYFLKSLQRCLQNPYELGPLIKRSERKLHMYVVYCQNKPVSEHIVSEHINYFDQLRLTLNYKLCLGDMLIKPVQRIMKYELLLKDIFKYTQKAGLVEEVSGLQEAMYIMRIVPKAANDMMDVGRLQKFEGKITAQGKLLLHGPLFCIEAVNNNEKNYNNVQKPKELHVFLFEQNIIFSEIVGKKTQFTSPAYIYKAHIQVNNMTLKDLSDSKIGNRFSVSSTDPQRSTINFICFAETPALHSEWFKTITDILQIQNDFIRAMICPILYQKRQSESASRDSK